MPITQAEAQAATLAFTRDYPGALELIYHFRESTGELYGHRAAEVPADLKGGYLSKEHIHNGRSYRGRVDVPLGNMDDAADLLVTLRHEVLGHYGANTFAPAEKRALLDGIIAAREQPGMKDRWEDINRRYAGTSMDVRAEEVWALHCETLAPGQHVGQAQVRERGEQSFMETCIARVRPMQPADLHNIVCMVADGLHDRSRTQQTFPQINELFRRDEAMEPKKPFHEVVAEKLIEQLKAGTAPWQRPWEPGEPNAYLPMNPTTGKRYKGINAIHLMAQGRSDGRWMTYKQAAAVGAQVRKGEKGTPVQYWKFSEEQNKVDESGRPVLNAKGEPVKETVQLERPRVFFATVFNAEQIDGLPPIQKKEQTWSAVERAEHILKASGASITHAPGDRAFYRPATDSIHLPDRGQFPSADNYYATALHELGHWTGHASRLDRDLAHPFGSEGYAKEELRAEIASMILGDELGIGHDPGQHAAYVGSWIKALQDEPLEVFRAAADAEKIHDYVLAFEQKQVQEQEQGQVQQTEAQQLQQLNDELREHGQEIVSHLDAQSRWADGERIFAFHEQDEQPHQVKSLAELESYAPDQLLALPALAQEQEQEAKMQAPEQIDQAEAWMLKHVELGTVGRALEGASLEQIDRALDVLGRMQPMNTQNEFWTRHELPYDLEPLEAKVNQAIDHLVEERRPDAVVAATRLDLATGNTNSRERDRQAFDTAADNALGFTLPHDWTGEVRVVGVVERDGETRPADLATETPETFHLYARKGEAQFGEDAFAYLTATRTLGEADELADRLALIDANSQTDEYEKATRLARVQEDRVRRDPNSTDEDISAAKEARKALEAKAFVAAEEAKNQQEQRTASAADQQPTQATQAGERQYISVPFKEKDEAKQLGARWDRKEQSWYVPAGVDAAPFAKWAQGAATAAAEARPTQQVPEAQGDGQKAAQQARQYLAVPYEQRTAAKAAGALWDKAAKSWYAGPRADMAKLEQWKPENVQAQQGPAMTPREEFAEAMRSAGLFTGSNAQGDHPIMDGKRHRVPVEGGKKGALDGFYVGHLDGHPAGRIINNKTGTDITWKSKGYALSDQEKAKLQAEAAEKLAQRAAEQDKLQEATAQRVGRQMADLVPVEQPTPYLQAKGIEAHAGVFTDREGQKTYIPAFDADGKQWTMQYIQEDGTKRFAKDSKKEGCFHPVGGMDALAAAPALVIAEGYATAASLSEGLGHATVAAFDSGNLPHVARALREKFPDKPIVIAGDDDKAQEIERGHNPGRAKAEEAAKAVGGKAIFPIFAPGEQQANPKGFTDFNDLANKSELGRDGLKRQVGAAVGQVLIEEGRRQQQEQRQERAEKQQQQPERPRRAARIG